MIIWMLCHMIINDGLIKAIIFMSFICTRIRLLMLGTLSSLANLYCDQIKTQIYYIIHVVKFEAEVGKISKC